MKSPPQLTTSYSTVCADDLLEQVVCDYRIEAPHQCLFWGRGANDTYEVRCAGAHYSLRVYRSGAYPREAMESKQVLRAIQGAMTRMDNTNPNSKAPKFPNALNIDTQNFFRTMVVRSVTHPYKSAVSW